MKNLLLVGLCFLVFLGAKGQEKTTAPLTKIIQKISDSYQNVAPDNKKGVKLTSVKATFTISKTTTVGGELKIWIFKLGRKLDKTKVRTITLELSMASKQDVNALNEKGAADLTKFIDATLADFKKLNDGKLFPDLNTRKVTIEIGLTITKNTTGGVDSFDIGIFSLAAEAGRNAEQGHTLELVFEKE